MKYRLYRMNGAEFNVLYEPEKQNCMNKAVSMHLEMRFWSAWFGEKLGETAA